MTSLLIKTLGTSLARPVIARAQIAVAQVCSLTLTGAYPLRMVTDRVIFFS